jgi:hypothetical protein
MNGVQADHSDHLGTELKRVLGGDAAVLNALLATLRPYLLVFVQIEETAALDDVLDLLDQLVIAMLARVELSGSPSRLPETRRPPYTDRMGPCPGGRLWPTQTQTTTS